MQFGRTPLLIVFAVLFLFLLVPLLRGSRGSGGLSDRDRAARTKEALDLIDGGELQYLATHGRFTSHLADLLPASPSLADDLSTPLSVQLDVGGAKGRSYYVQVAGSVVSLVKARTGQKVAAEGCTVLRSRSRIKCEQLTGPTQTGPTQTGTSTTPTQTQK